MTIVAVFEVGHCGADFLDILEDAAVDRLLLQRPVEAFGYAVGLPGLLGPRLALRAMAIAARMPEMALGAEVRTSRCGSVASNGRFRKRLPVSAYGRKRPFSEHRPLVAPW